MSIEFNAEIKSMVNIDWHFISACLPFVNIKFSLTKEILKKDIFINSETKISVNISSPYQPSTITDECTLITGLREVFLIKFPLLHQISSPNHDRTYMQSCI